MKYVMTSLCLLTLGACVGNSFKAGGVQKAQAEASKPESNADVNVEPTPDASSWVKKTAEFSLKSERPPMDMVWVIDNSGSMADEIAQVRANFQKFIDTVGGRADLKLSLISTSVGAYGIQLPAGMSGHQQLDYKVNSTDGLAMLAGAICAAPEGTSPGKGVLPCGVEGRYRIKNPNTTLAGSLSAAMRPGAERVFVFVTDDDAENQITKDNFLTVTGSDPVKTHVYAFSGVEDQPGCTISERGLAYEALAQTTGGATFDICAKDWSANFGLLSESIIKWISSQFSVPATGEFRILSVKVGDKILNDSQYKISGKDVELLDASIAALEGQLIITYEIKE